MLQITLKAARVNAGKTQKEIAKYMNVNVSTIINWESGHSLPRADQLRTLCSYYQISVDNIFLPN